MNRQEVAHEIEVLSQYLAAIAGTTRSSAATSERIVKICIEVVARLNRCVSALNNQEEN